MTSAKTKEVYSAVADLFFAFRQMISTERLLAFRVSPEEAKMIEVAASVTGMFKQDYYISKLLDRTVVVQGSCKIHRALYDRLTETLEELKRIEAGSGVDPDLLEIIQTITQIVDNLYIK